MVAELPRLLDPDDLLDMPDGDNYELIDGVLVEKEMGARASMIAMSLGAMLYNFVKLHRLGHVFDADAGYVCFPNHPKTVHKPDYSFVARGRFPGNSIPNGHITFAPDLAIEVISPENRYEEIDDKLALYRSAGVRLVWVVVPSTQKAYIYRANGTLDEVGPDGSLSGEDVIPGFSCRIAEIFEE
ncbi:hypothetical protein BH11PLA2_BH11PLA2_09000 [soil metagenome]